MSSSIYHEAIKSLAEQDRGHGRLLSPRHAAQLDNPLCGDRVEMDVEVGDGRIVALAHRVNGCLLCRASASVIGINAVGTRVEEFGKVFAELEELLEHAGRNPALWPILAMFVPVHGRRSRYGCVLLPFRALATALDSPDPLSRLPTPVIP